MSRMTPELLRQIQAMLAMRLPQRLISRRLGVARTVVKNVANGKYAIIKLQPSNQGGQI
jgi:hypothetical protein